MTVHFVNFRHDRQRIMRAVAIWGVPDFIHFHWDARARAEIQPDDVVIFADGCESDPICPYTYDDSAHQ